MQSKLEQPVLVLNKFYMAVNVATAKRSATLMFVGHAEAVQIIYDPGKVSYEKLLNVFWHNIDPTTPDQQFCDRGNQYRSEIFFHDDEQKQLAEASKSALEKNKPFKKPIVTQISKASTFYAAEDYHQDYYKKNPIRYKYYRYGCGRDKRLEQLWGKE